MLIIFIIQFLNNSKEKNKTNMPVQTINQLGQGVDTKPLSLHVGFILR